MNRMAPDLLIAFLGADPEACREDNGYVISVHGKPPDFVMEIASRSTGRQDVEGKRTGYAGLGIPEYWRCRRGRGVPRHTAGRRPAGTRAIRAHHHRDRRGRNPAGLQRSAQPLHPVGTRGVEVARPGDRAAHRQVLGPSQPGGKRTGSPRVSGIPSHRGTDPRRHGRGPGPGTAG